MIVFVRLFIYLNWFRNGYLNALNKDNLFAVSDINFQ